MCRMLGDIGSLPKKLVLDGFLSGEWRSTKSSFKLAGGSTISGMVLVLEMELESDPSWLSSRTKGSSTDVSGGCLGMRWLEVGE